MKAAPRPAQCQLHFWVVQRLNMHGRLTAAEHKMPPREAIDFVYAAADTPGRFGIFENRQHVVFQVIFEF